MQSKKAQQQTNFICIKLQLCNSFHSSFSSLSQLGILISLAVFSLDAGDLATVMQPTLASSKVLLPLYLGFIHCSPSCKNV